MSGGLEARRRPRLLGLLPTGINVAYPLTPRGWRSFSSNYSLDVPVLPTIAEADRGRNAPVIGGVRVAGRWDEDDPVDSPAAERHRRATATRPRSADLPAALGGPLER